ncbi:MAG TPA: nucleoside-diphosphate sugar epimerase [Rheinheimera sp.]|nr:nucleoside-diphosphate sugar epimerase [Rheinheimera sp.]
MLDKILSLPRVVKKTVLVTSDVVVLLIAAGLAAYLTQPDPWEVLQQIMPLVLFSLPGTLYVFTKLGLYRAVIRFIDEHALGAVLAGVASNTAIMLLLFTIAQIAHLDKLVLVHALIALIGCGSSRMAARMLLFPRHTAQKRKEPVLIYGAGSSGRQLAQALLNGEQYQPVAFVDDDPTLQKSTILGMPVGLPSQISLLVKTKNIRRILLAIPSASRIRRRQLLDSLENIPIPVQTVPGMMDIVDGHFHVDSLEDVKIEDLLGRDPVEPDWSLLQANIFNKVVMVTGAGGSIGSELCRQIVSNRPSKLILFELSEFALYSIHRELLALCQKHKLDCAIVPVIGNVQSQTRLLATMQRFHVDTVYHAAAYKHVPMVEFNVLEGVRNNVFGTWRCAEAAIQAGVSTFVLISTDKAVRPTNLMGASKRLAELVLQGLAKRQTVTRFCMVRFGNVLGSSGSVVPLFREQIRQGGPVTVTHPDIYRYFMTIPEAAQLVIQAGAMGQGGDVFVLDMGEPVRIVDLARRMIHLMGLEVVDERHPDGDIEIKFTGLRPGEKLFEELLIGDDVKTTQHARICAANETALDWHDMKALLRQLEHHCELLAVEQVVALIKDAPIGLNGHERINDLVDQRETKASIAKPTSAALDTELPNAVPEAL